VSKLLELAWIVPAIFGQFLMPRIARSFQTRGDHDLGDFTHVLRLMYGIVVAASVGGALFAEPILALVFGSQAKGGGSILRWLMVYLVLDAMDMLQGIVLKCAGLQATDVRIHVSNLAGNVASSLVLMPMFGGVGAAAARCLGVCCSLILRGVYVSRRLVRIPWLSLVGSPVVGSSALAVALRPFLGSTRPFVLMAGYAVAAGILLVYWATRPQLGPRPGA
jgi:O-antigen/teichoic acid export membrane protein